jgi:cysteine synthase
VGVAVGGIAVGGVAPDCFEKLFCQGWVMRNSDALRVDALRVDSLRADRAWVDEAVRKIEGDYTRTADTHLITLDLPPSLAIEGVDVYFKDESTHPTGSLKHRLGRSLLLYALCNGWVGPKTTLVEASSGSTAISEAYFARLIGLPFIAVVPESTAQSKCDLIRFYGGQVHFVKRADEVYEAARELAKQTGGHYMDQFTYAERATDWRGNNNIAESVFAQMAHERYPVPSWVVVGAGTGGTSATFGRFVRYKRLPTQVAVVDPENSVFHDYFHGGDQAVTSAHSSRIEGIGRPRAEPSFIRQVISDVLRIRDLDSIAAMRLMSEWLGRRVGPSTGTNLVGVFQLMRRMQANGEQGSIVSLICDGGDRYTHLYDNAWVAEHIGLGLEEHQAALLA